MHTVVVGAGPTGLFTAVALARRGSRVTVVDRDPGPRSDGSWDRRGVMQFHHPHAFRPQVGEALRAEMPEVWDALLAAGARPTAPPGPPGPPPGSPGPSEGPGGPAGPGGPSALVGLRCRRLTFERVLRAATEAQPGVELRLGHVDDVVEERGRAAGVRVDGHRVEADLVVDASGRSGRLGRGRRAPAEVHDSGVSYVSRQYRLHPGAEPGPLNSPIGNVSIHVGYIEIVFEHDNGTFSVLIARSSSEAALAALRFTDAFDAATRAIPALAVWTDPARSAPITDVLPGGRLYNSYQGQLDDNGHVALPGLVFVGDAVCTTNPTAGRGITTSLRQAHQLVQLLDADPDDPASCSRELHRWCAENIEPWFRDHVEMDDGQISRWSGHDIDLTRPLPSDMISAAAEVDPSMMAVLGPYLAMLAPPASIAVLQDRARAIYAGGWRPPVPPGPTREELVDLVARNSPATGGSDFCG